MSAEIVLTEDTLRYISLFEAITKANVKDCMDTDDKLVFVVDKGQGNIAVGKKLSTSFTFHQYLNYVLVVHVRHNTSKLVDTPL